MPQTRLEALHRVLTALVAHPQPAALVLACTDLETPYLHHALTRLDEQSPCDRIFTASTPVPATTDLSTYLDHLELATTPHPRPIPEAAPLPRPIPEAALAAPLPHLDPEASQTPRDDPFSRLQALLARLLADLPPGDHRLVVALVPHEIGAPAAFAALAEALLTAPLDPRLRLIVRDDRLTPRHFLTAATCPEAHVLAYSFELPPELALAAVLTAAHDPHRPPDERAQALLQLACQDLGHRRHADALARCDAITRLPASPPLRALALALKADVLRHRGDPQAALALALFALARAVELGALPVVLHAALTLGELTRELGRTAEAAACFDLAARAATFNPAAQTHVRALRSALDEARC